jgi:alpha-L-rhamnosidase
MNSFNHYAYGAIGDWMYRVLAGIDTDVEGPGYKKITIKPHIGGKLTQADATFKTNYGKLSSNWKLEDGKFIINIEIPANTTAEIFLPAKSTDIVTESGIPIAEISNIKKVGYLDGCIVLKIGSGKYNFEIRQ